MDFSLLPPEINSARMYTGAGATPLLEAASAWDSLSSQLTSSAGLFSDQISTLLASWSGPSSVAMSNAAAKYVSSLNMTAERARQTAVQAVAAAGAYQNAFAETVPPALISENRTQLATLVATNFLGVNTAAIALTEAEYAEMWAQDATAMTAYAAASSAATSALPGWDIFAPGSNSETTGLAGLLNMLSGSTGSAFGSLINASFVNSIASSAFLNPGETWAPILGLASLYPAFSMLSQQQQGLFPGGGNASSGTRMPTPVSSPRYPSVSANAGSARSIGNLRAPSSWAVTGTTTGPTLSVGTPMITEEIPPTFPAVMPPIVGSPGGKLERPKYGTPVKVINSHPSIG